MLKKEQVTLAAVEPTTKKFLHQWLQNYQFLRLQGASILPKNIVEVDRVFESRFLCNSNISFQIESESESEPIGLISLSNIDWPNRSAELGIMIGKTPFQGKGYGRISLSLIIDYGFQQLALHRIYLRVLASNTKAINLYESIGFKKEGTFRECVFIDGEWNDELSMSILNK